MNKYLPIVLMGAVVLFAVAGFFYVSSRKNASSTHIATDISPTSVKKEVTPAPTESVIVSMIPLTIDSPKDGTSTTASKLLVSGHTVANAEVFINDVSAKADRNGNFKAYLTLDEGDNYILVFANDEEGNYAQQEMTVTYTAP